ncbi:cell division protein FtsZ [Sediminibacterium roseum]|uniref:Cell division protein FtsZ n=1 Tax=Sediminibacterium roseum TaxID=1978412 RepID=A0ABW9ZPX4_9BACT|nr:cell division protein FtsZ [Sediminibacterium roseum]NCI49151.1 cell division protein FtsZ [Sediminibacterium roseum]
MIHFDLPKQKSSIIKVLGVGGGGSNAVNFMFEQNIEGVDFIICNTDAKAIEQSNIPNKIQLGPHLTQGLGAGANPEVGKKATEESLEEIKRILEVNTKMAFITVGMGGGTGTGGAPIIAQICKELGILTVGIVTTPFGFEGPRRLQQAEEGIMKLKPFVDTLLVISNDKLRIQYGNLKMKEAFGKADNVLATAAKCITDIINSRGHIIVDFADVCTVMKSGGVAILGKAEVEGEDRAQRAIEEALSSPLLNDNDITGAKWILININSAEGEHECTMDELETINNYLRMQAGPDTDVIVGMGYEAGLDKKIGITLIATGFEHKDPFAKPVAVKQAEPQPEKIVMTLETEVPKAAVTTPVAAPAPQPTPAAVEPTPVSPKLQEVLSVINEEKQDFLAPSLQERQPIENLLTVFNKPEFTSAPVHFYEEVKEVVQEKESMVLQFELSPEITAEVKEQEPAKAEAPKTEREELVSFKVSEQPTQPASTIGSFLSKPSNIYAEQEAPVKKPVVAEIKPAPAPQPPPAPKVEETEMEMQIVMKEEPKAMPQADLSSFNDEYSDEAEDQKRRAAERIQKLRNLSFNMNNSSDANNEFDAVPAYVRRNMELFGNTLTSVENFYSKYTVGKDENDQTQISTINTFLDGKKPD